MPALALDWKELAHRSSHGLDVRLVWSRAAGRVKVVVTDSWLDDGFELHIANGDALDAFEHPFAYVDSASDAAPRAARSLMRRGG